LILLDTNILLRYASAADPDFAVVEAAVNTLRASGEVLCTVPQNVYEFWAAATRPTAANGLGLSVAECQAEVARIKRLFRLLPDQPALFAEWEALVAAHNCQGRPNSESMESSSRCPVRGARLNRRPSVPAGPRPLGPVC
jgi:hypothetical protein